MHPVVGVGIPHATGHQRHRDTSPFSDNPLVPMRWGSLKATANPRLAVGALSALAALTCRTMPLHGQTFGDGGAPFALTFSYTGDLQQNAHGGEARGVAFAGVGGAELTARLGRLVGWYGASIFIFALDTHGSAPSHLVGDVQGVSSVEAPVSLQLEEA